VTQLLNGDATREGLEAALSEVRRRAHPGDQVLVYFAGYGTRDAEGRPALVLYDDDPSAESSSLTLEALAAALPAGVECLLLVDAGFDGQRRSLALAPNHPRLPWSLEGASGWRALFACQPGAPLLTPEHLGGGLFSYHLSRGLAGGADLDGDGSLTISELAHFSREKVIGASAFFGSPQEPSSLGESEAFTLKLTAPPPR
jgi:uncharacterized caspase-like protein